jgi:hypothetical protein
VYQDVKFWVVSLLGKKYHSECHSDGGLIGSPTNIDVQIGSMKIGIAEYRYRDTISIFGQFAPDIEVRLLLRVLTEISDQNIIVFYSWKKLKDEYDTSQLGL